MAEPGFFDALADEASQEDFLRRELAGSAPQYDPEGGLNTAKNIGRMAAEMTPPGAAASAAGYMGEPSMFQNIGSGDYGTAALQAAGLIPGIGWMGKAGRLAKGARRASEVIPPSVAREVGATPRGMDIDVPRSRPSPIVEGEAIPLPPPKNINARPERGPSSYDLQELPSSYDEIASIEPYRQFSPADLPEKTRAALLKMREEGRGPSPFERNWMRAQGKKYPEFSAAKTAFATGESVGMNNKIFDVLTRAQLGGKPLTPFEQNMVNNYMASFQPKPTMGIHGDVIPEELISSSISNRIAAEEAKREKIARMSPKMRENMEGARAIANARDQEEYQKWLINRLGLNQPGSDLHKSYFNQAYLNEELPTLYRQKNVLAPEPTPKESLLKRALNIASRVGPRVAEGMAVGAPAGMATGLAYNAMMNRGDMPVVPIANREERPVIAPMQLREFPMSTAMGTDFESVPSIASDMPQETALPPRRPMGISRSGEAPIRHPSAPRHAAPIHRSAQRHVGPSRMVDSGKRYYGDWRDAEPYASDPIGGFIDELTGRTRTARHPGRAAPPSVGLGDLLPFASGGAARRPFADGGAEDRIPVLSDIGDALGGLMQGGEQPVVASDRGAAPEGRENIFERWSNNPLSQYLFAAGLGMMASPQANPLMAVGEGGLRGLEYMQAVQANADMRRREREAAQQRRQDLEIVRNIDKDNSPSQTPDVPLKTSSVDTQAAAPVTPIETAQTATKVAPEAATAVQPVVASDGRLQELERINEKIINRLPYIETPSAKAALMAKQKAVESEINRIYRQREKAVQDARYQEQLNFQKERLEEQKRQASQEGITEKVMTEESAKHLSTNRSESKTKLDEIQQLDQMKRLVDSKAGIHTGLTSGMWSSIESIPTVRNYISNEEAQKADNTRMFDNLTKQLVFTSVNGKFTQGFTDADRDFMMSLQPSISDSENTIKAKIEMAKRVKERELELLKKEREYVQRKGYLDEGFNDELEKWSNENPTFPELPGNQKAIKPSKEELLREQQRRREQRG